MDGHLGKERVEKRNEESVGLGSDEETKLRVFATGFLCGVVFSFTDTMAFVAGVVSGYFVTDSCYRFSSLMKGVLFTGVEKMWRLFTVKTSE